MSLGRDGRERSGRSGGQGCRADAPARRRRTPPIGRCARWPGKAASHTTAHRILQPHRSETFSWTGPRHHRPLVSRGQIHARPYQPVLPMLPGMPAPPITSATERPRCSQPSCRRVPSSARRRHRAREPTEGDRPTRSRRAGHPHRHGQLRHPQDAAVKAWLARRPHWRSLHTDLGVPGRTLVAATAARRAHLHPPARRISGPSSKNTTKTPSPSGGPNRPTTSPPSSASASVSIKIYAANFRSGD